MNIYHYKYFVDAARNLSISQSAKLNLVSHSAVSQAIKALEEQLEVKLVFHSKRRFQLTPEGEKCYLRLTELLSHIQNIKEELKLSSQEVAGELVIWAPQSLVVDSLYTSLAKYQKKYPKVKILLKTGPAAQVRNAVSSKDGHIGILVDDGFLKAFASKSLRSGEFVLISPSRAISGDSKILVTSEKKLEVDYLIKNFKKKTKKDLKIGMQVMSWGVIKSLVLKDFGVGYVPDYTVKEELRSEKLYKIKTPFKPFGYNIQAIWPPKKQLNRNAQLFLDILSEEFSL